MRRIGTVLLVVIALAAFAASAGIGVRALSPLSSDRRIAAQITFLHDALDDGAGERMQQLFPEGEFFTEALTGMAAANLGRRDPDRRAWATEAVRRALAAIEAERVTREFSGMVFEHGIFWRGWRAQLLVDLAILTGDQRDVAAAAQEAAAILAAIDAEPSGFVESYPGQRWPCDTVVAMSAVSRAAALAPIDGFSGAKERWLERIATARDPRHGDLLVHRVDADGRPTGGVRGTSQSIIQSFWPDIADSTDEWRAFSDQFLVRRAGLLGVLEYPRDAGRGAGDVDSGPLVLGVSLSASATTLAAVRRHGDLTVARGLDAEAEMFGLPWGIRSRRFAFGLLPVGDAFVAWARSVDLEEVPAAPNGGLSPRLWSWALGTAVPGVLAVWGLSRQRRRAAQ